MITFFKKKDEHEWMSNFSAHPVRFGDTTYPTAEHAFQAAKFTQHAYQHSMYISALPTPAQAKAAGKSRKHQINDHWDTERVDVMRTILRAKLETNSGLAAKLEATGDEELGEANPFDYFWGLGKSGKGKNWMGRIWMEIRQERRA